MTKPTAEQIAKIFNVPVEGVRKLALRCAAQSYESANKGAQHNFIKSAEWRASGDNMMRIALDSSENQPQIPDTPNIN